ncbi:MAG TPA: hypothetical protein VL463_31940 [Kofleriaceae bacterium]|nr:hypothetical protein [Kofleriaceae bacterium]
MSIQKESVAIESIHVGDFVIVEGARHPACVLGLTTTRHRLSNRVIGWLVELEGGESVFLRRGARVTRHAS